MKLFIIPTPISKERYDTIPHLYKKIILALDYFFVENPLKAKKFIEQFTERKDISLHIFSLNEIKSLQELDMIFRHTIKGNTVGLLSDAGCPAISDPGNELVNIARKNHYSIIPLVGPNSIILALMASGLNGQKFFFHGYLPIERNERKKTVKNIEKKSFLEKATQIFIETPHRNKQMFEDICNICNKNTLLCIAKDITGVDEFILTTTIEEWRKKKMLWKKKPTVFLIQAV